MLLPVHWHSTIVTSLTPPESIYGFTYNVDEPSYSLFLTNFSKVWSEVLSAADFIEKTNRYGIEDLSYQKSSELFKLLERSLQKSVNFVSEEPETSENQAEAGLDKGRASQSQTDGLSNAEIPQKEAASIKEHAKISGKQAEAHENDQSAYTAPDQPIRLLLKTTGDFPWTFILTENSPHHTVQFLANLNQQQFANHRYLQEQLNHLKSVVSIKDSYIKFLYENLKLSHGVELFDKFKNNNKQNAQYFSPFDEKTWQEDFERVHHRDLQWNSIQKCIDDSNTWAKSSQIITEAAEIESDDDASGPYFTSPLKPSLEYGEPSDDPMSSPIKKTPTNLLQEKSTPILKPASQEKRKRKFGSLPTKKQKRQ